jgi:hypothetical protein
MDEKIMEKMKEEYMQKGIDSQSNLQRMTEVSINEDETDINKIRQNIFKKPKKEKKKIKK